MLQRAWHLPLRKLVLGDADHRRVIVALRRALIVGLGWPSRSCSARCSPPPTRCSPPPWSPTRACRGIVRHSLNLESGLNDGLALPAVLAFAAALGDRAGLRVVAVRAPGRRARASRSASRSGSAPRADPARPQADRVDPGPRAVAVRARRRVRDLRRRRRAAARGQRLDRGLRRRDHARDPAPRHARDASSTAPTTSSRSSSSGSSSCSARCSPLDGLFGDGWAAVAIVAVTLLVARPVAVWLALAGTGRQPRPRAFMAWFGPKGVATMTFSLLVLGEGVPGAERIFNLAALCVFASIIAHGLTDTPGIGVARSGVKRGLLLRVRERPGGLPAPLLPEHEAQLLRRPQPLRDGPDGRSGRARRARARTACCGGRSSPRTDLRDLAAHVPPPSSLVHHSVTDEARVKRAAGVQAASAQEFPQSAGFSSVVPANRPDVQA